MLEIDDIRINIDTYSSYITANEAKIKQLEEKYEEGLEVKRKLKKTEKDLEDVETTRKKRLEELKTIENVAFVKRYTENMENVHTGIKRSNAYMNIEAAVGKVEGSLKKILEEIEELDLKNKAYKEKIDDCESEIRNMQLKEKEEN